MSEVVTLEHGQQFGQLTVLKRLETNRGIRYRCGCTCGYARVRANATQLIQGRITSCDKCAGKMKPHFR